MARAQGKHREFGIIWSVATLTLVHTICAMKNKVTILFLFQLGRCSHARKQVVLGVRISFNGLEEIHGFNTKWTIHGKNARQGNC